MYVYIYIYLQYVNTNININTHMICIYIYMYIYASIQDEFDHITSLDLPLKHSDKDCLPFHYTFSFETLLSNP